MDPMGDLRDPRWMYVKAALLLGIGVIASVLIVLETMSWRVAGLLGLAIWAFARAYYFAFYVIERYIDPGYKFAGLWSFTRYAWRRGAKGEPDRRPRRERRGDPEE